MVADEPLQASLILADAFLKKSSVDVNDVCKFTDYPRFTDNFFENVSVNL